MDNFTARRKLLKGTLSAPVVLTVASPAALAQTTFTSCLVNGAPPPSEYIASTASAEDTYYRVAKNVFTLSGRQPFGNELAYEFLDNYYKASDGVLLGAKSTNGVSIKPNTTVSRQFIAYVDNTGALKGWGYPSTSGGGTLAMKSCYNSLLIQPR